VRRSILNEKAPPAGLDGLAADYADIVRIVILLALSHGICSGRGAFRIVSDSWRHIG